MHNYIQNLLAKYEFWRARKIKLNVDFDIMHDISQQDGITIRLLKKFPSVIVGINNVNMGDDSNVSFDMTIIANPNLCNTESRRFKRFVTDIFRSIIVDSIKEAKRIIDENGKLDPVESVEERGIHEEISSILEERVPVRKPRKKAVRRSKEIHSDVQQSTSDSGSGDQS